MNFEEKIIERLKRLEREVERLRVKERPAGGSGVTDHGALTGLEDNDHPQYLLTTGKAADSDKLDGLNSTDFGRPVFLTTQLTSTSWDGDSFSTTGKTLIDLSSVFDVPAGVKAVIASVSLRDSGSAGSSSGCYLILSPNSTSYIGVYTYCAGLANDAWTHHNIIVPCDANGDVYYQINASGSATMDVYLEIWGYWL